tara:strand:+ start:411 stop:650 length:240 start_codon:yes stop_codon:yes gene_type:complete
MKKLLGLILFSVLTSFSTNLNNIQQTEMVFVCTHPSIKCYFSKPCDAYFKMCQTNNGAILKVSVARAKAMKKEKCDCEE